MDSRFSLLLLLPALFAQSSVPPAQPPRSAGNPTGSEKPDAVQQPPNRSVPPPTAITPRRVTIGETSAGVCSIPLVNVLKGKTLDKMAIAPRSPAREHLMQENYVTLPAPPCDDGKK